MIPELPIPNYHEKSRGVKSLVCLNAYKSIFSADNKKWRIEVLQFSGMDYSRTGLKTNTFIAE